MVSQYIPQGFARLGMSSVLGNATIAFARAPDTVLPVTEVFGRVSRALELYFGEGEPPSSAAEAALLMDAIELFDNPSGLADGGAAYGISFHRLGAGVDGFGNQDENYRGPEHFNITIRDTMISDIVSRPLMHPTLTTAQGEILQGPVRDVVNIIDVTDFGDSNFDPDGRMRMVSVAQYAGNLLSDAYVALWTVANAFYEAYVLETRGCGNFGSNLTSPYGQCAATSKTPTLTGRDVAMVQKRFFGGLKLTQAFVDFATVPGYSLGDLLAKNPEVIARRQSRHYLLCNGDAMFHPGKGVVGVKLDFVGGVSLKNVTIAKVENAGDDGHWLCDRQRTYRLPKTGELVAVQRIDGGTYKGGDARGLRLGKSAGVVMDDVYIDDIVALEGAAYGVDMGADTNDQSDWESSSIDFGDVEIGSAIRAGAGARAFPLATGANPGALRFFSKGKGGGLAIADGPERHHQFDRPRILLSYGFWEKQSMNATDLFGKMNDEGRPVDYYRNLTERIFGGDLGRIYAQRQKAVNWLYEQHGVVVDVPENTDWLETVTMPNGDEFYAGNVFPDLHKYPGVAVCAGAECTGNELQTVAWHDLIWTYEVKSENLTYYGAFGGVEGWKAQIGDAILIGTYSVEGLPFDNGNNIFIDYYATCPLRFNQYYNQSSLAEGVVEVTRTQVMLNCEVESGVLGKGITIGVVSNFWDPDTSKVENRYLIQIAFDDVPYRQSQKFKVKTEDIAIANDLFPFQLSNALVPRLVLHVFADGELPGAPAAVAGLEVFPLSSLAHFPNEAGVKCFKDFTPLGTDEAIVAFRSEFVAHLRDYVGLTKILNADLEPNLFANEPAANTIDLGGGNVILPYALNDAFNQRVVVRTTPNSTADFPNDGGFLEDGARVRECGFKLQVGRAGLSTTAEYVPYGSLIRFGYYLVELPDGHLLLTFKDNFPTHPTAVAHYEMTQSIFSDTFGPGHMSGLGKVLPDGPDAMRVETRFGFWWY